MLSYTSRVRRNKLEKSVMFGPCLGHVLANAALPSGSSLTLYFHKAHTVLQDGGASPSCSTAPKPVRLCASPTAACIAAPRCHSAGWSETGSWDVWEQLETHEQGVRPLTPLYNHDKSGCYGEFPPYF